MCSFACTQWAEEQQEAQPRPALRCTRKDAQPYSPQWAAWKDGRHCTPALAHCWGIIPRSFLQPLAAPWAQCCNHAPSTCPRVNRFSLSLGWLGDSSLPKQSQKSITMFTLIGNAVQVPVVRAPWSLQRPYLCINYRLPQRLSNQQFATPAQCYNWSFSRHPPSYLIKPFKPFCILFIGAVKNPRTQYKESFLLFCIAL